MIAILGYVSGVLLAICGIPQSYHSWKLGHCEGVSKLFIWIWFLGEVGICLYTLLDIGFNGPLVLNYVCNMICCMIILKYLHFPRKTNS